MDRRQFLKIGGIISVGVGGLLVLRTCPEPVDDPDSRMSFAIRQSLDALRHYYPDLPFADEDAIAYLEDYEKHIRPLNPDVVQSSVFQKRFLLSTNALVPHRGEDEPVEYRTLYHPYINPCYNPLTV